MNDKAKLHPVQLKKAHTDAGTSYAAGDVIEVDEATKAWLIENDIAEEQPKDGAIPARTRTSAAG